MFVVFLGRGRKRREEKGREREGKGVRGEREEFLVLTSSQGQSQKVDTAAVSSPGLLYSTYLHKSISLHTCKWMHVLGTLLLFVII